MHAHARAYVKTAHSYTAYLIGQSIFYSHMAIRTCVQYMDQAVEECELKNLHGETCKNQHWLLC